MHETETTWFFHELDREPLEDYEAAKLVESAAEMGTEYELLIRTLSHTGLRANEFANMQADWINFQKEEIRVPPEEGDWTPKSRAGSRLLPLRGPHTKRVLRNWYSVQDGIRMCQTTIWRRVTEVTD